MTKENEPSRPELDDKEKERIMNALSRQSGGCLVFLLSLTICLGGGYLAWEQKDWTMLAFFETAGASGLVWSVGQMRE